MKHSHKASPKHYWLEGTIFLLGLGFIHAFFLSNVFRGDGLDPQKAAQFGDLVGGYIGTIFGLASVCLLVLTLREQIRQNRAEGFERRFFQLMDYHRQHVSEIGIGEKTGRRTFVTLIREFRRTLDAVKEACQEQSIALDEQDRINVAYTSFYYGTGPNSTRILKQCLTKFDTGLVDAVIAKLDGEASAQTSQADLKLGYKPFEGHQSRLGHYFRHLYQTICYIDSHAGARASEYADLMRAQLSNHEQALLCLNSLSTVGSAWKSKGLIVRHQLIKNLPRDFFNPETELDVTKYYGGIAFEYLKQSPEEPEPNRDS